MHQENLNDERLVQLIADRLEVSPDRVTRDSDFLLDLGADSLTLAGMLGDVERLSGVAIQADDLLDVVTVGDLQRLLKTRVAESSQRERSS